MSTDKDTHTIQFCCGTTCDAEANLLYVKELEDELKTAQRTIRLLHRKVDRRNHYIDQLEEQVDGLIKGDTTGAT